MGRQFVKLRGRAVDGVRALHVQLIHAINRLADDIHHTALNLLACRHGDGASRRYHFQSSLQTIGVVHGHTAHGVFTDVLLHFDDKLLAIRALHLERLINLGEHLLSFLTLGIEIYIDNRADNLRDASIYL